MSVLESRAVTQPQVPGIDALGAPTWTAGAAHAGPPTATAADVAGAISPRVVTRFLVACTVALTALHLVAAWLRNVAGRDHALGLVPLFDFNLESNAPTWFSSALLLVAGLAAIMIASRDRRHRWQWAAMGFVAVFLSLDESAQIHEMVSAVLRSALALEGDFSWAIVGIVSGLPLLVGAVLFYRFMRAVPRETARGLMLAGAVYVAGVIGVDTIAALAHAGSGGWVLVTALNTVEELLEMLGVILLIHVLLTHLVRDAAARPASA